MLRNARHWHLLHVTTWLQTNRLPTIDAAVKPWVRPVLTLRSHAGTQLLAVAQEIQV
jgi:hypothetical protein